MTQHNPGSEYINGRAAAHEVGMANRRAVLGDAHVDASVEKMTPVTEKFQDFITRTAWGDVWQREGLDFTERRLLTIAILTAVAMTVSWICTFVPHCALAWMLTRLARCCCTPRSMLACRILTTALLCSMQR